MATLPTVNGKDYVTGMYTGQEAFEQTIRDCINASVNEKFQPTLQETAFERSKIARENDFLAAIPLIGSLFGLARMIASAGVALYYKWHEKNDAEQSRIMLLRATDEFKLGFAEFIPLGGMFVHCVLDQSPSSPLILPGARGQYYCEHAKELYY